MPLTKRERKERLKKGAQKRIAVALKLSETTVSMVNNRKTQSLHRDTIRLVQEAIAAELGLPVEEAFAEAAVAAVA
jgi:DNA-binding LacI/PurR family transcriptional regulator